MLPGEDSGCPFTSRFCSVPGASIKLLTTGSDTHRTDLTWQASSKANQKRASLLDLPRELRDQIFNYAFATDDTLRLGVVTLAATHPYHWHPERTLRRFLPGSFEVDRSIALADRKRAFCIGLLSTCKQIHYEAASALYGNNTFETHVHFDAQWKASFEQDTPFADDISALDMLPLVTRYQSLVHSAVFRPYLIGSRDGFKVLQTFQSAFRNIPGAFAGYSLRPEGSPDCHDIGLFAYADRPRVNCRDIYAGWDRRGAPSVLFPPNSEQCQKRRKGSATREMYLWRKSNFHTPVSNKPLSRKIDVVTFKMRLETMLKLSAALMHSHGVPISQSFELPAGDEIVNVHFTTAKPMALKLVLAQVTGEDEEGFSYWKVGPEVLGITAFPDNGKGAEASIRRGSGPGGGSYGYFRNKLDRAWTMWYWGLEQDTDGYVRRRAAACVT